MTHTGAPSKVSMNLCDWYDGPCAQSGPTVMVGSPLCQGAVTCLSAAILHSSQSAYQNELDTQLNTHLWFPSGSN